MWLRLPGELFERGITRPTLEKTALKKEEGRAQLKCQFKGGRTTGNAEGGLAAGEMEDEDEAAGCCSAVILFDVLSLVQ